MFNFKLKNNEILEHNNGIPLVSDEGSKREIKELIKQGYIHKDGKPIKCTKYNCEKLEKYDIYYIDNNTGMKEEYSIRCSKCQLPTTLKGSWLVRKLLISWLISLSIKLLRYIRIYRYFKILL